MLNFTAAASTGVSSWKMTPFRSLNVQGGRRAWTSTTPRHRRTNLPSGVMFTSPQPTFIATHIIS